MSDFERYGWEPDGSRKERTEPPPAPVKTEESGSTGLALVAGLVAAIVGGMAWGLISKYTSYEVGIVAWGIGFLCRLRRRARRGRPPLGRPAGDRDRDGAARRPARQVPRLRVRGPGGAAGPPAHTPACSPGEMFTLFRENLSEVFGLFDLLWTGLAVASAWYALRPEPRRAGAGARADGRRRCQSRSPSRS